MKSFNKSIVGSIRLPEADKPKTRDVPTGFKRVEAEVAKNSSVPTGLNAVDPYRVKYHAVKRAIKSERTFPLGFGCMRCLIELINGIHAFGDCAIVGGHEAPTESAKHGAKEAAIEHAVKILCGMSEEKQKELETLALKTEHKKETVDFKSPELEYHELRCKRHILNYMPHSTEGPKTMADSNFNPYVSYVFRADTLNELNLKFRHFIIASVKVFSAVHKEGELSVSRKVTCQVRRWPRIRKTHVGDYMLKFRGTFYPKEG